MSSLTEALMLPTRRCNWCEKHISFERSVTGHVSCLCSLRTHCVTVYVWLSIRWYTQRNSDLKRVEGSVESCSGNAHRRSDIRGNDSFAEIRATGGLSQLSPLPSRQSHSPQVLRTRQNKMAPTDSTVTIKTHVAPLIPGEHFNMVWNKGMLYLRCFPQLRK